FHDVSQNFNHGIRATIGYRECEHAVELTGFYLFQAERAAFAVAQGRLDLPFSAFPSPLGFQGDNFLWLQADRVAALSQTRLGSVEANYRYHHCHGLEWLFGVRYLDQDERFSIVTDDDGLTVRPINLTQVATYTIRSHNRIVAPQLGFEYEHPLVHGLTVGITGKGAWGANFLNVDLSLDRGDGFQGPRSHRAE